MPRRSASHREAPLDRLHVVDRRLELMRGDAPRLLLDTRRGHHARASTQHHAAAGERTRAAVDLSGVAMQHAHLIERHVQLIGDHLRKRRFVPLAMAVGTSDQRHLSVALHAHAAALAARATARLDKRRDTDAHQLASCPSRLSPFHQVGVAHQVERLIERRRVVARVIFGAGCRVVRKVLGSDEVLPAQLDRIHVQLCRHAIDAALDGQHRFGSPGAAVGSSRRRVGEDGQALDADVGDPVAARCHVEDECRRYGRRRVQVGAHVGDVAQLQTSERPVPLCRQIDLNEHVAALRRGLNILAARRHPLHRSLQLQGEVSSHDVLGCGAALAAEAPPDVRGDHSHVVLPQSECARQISA